MSKSSVNYTRITALGFLLLGLSYWSFGPFDPDLGWHLYGGKWVSTHGTPPIDDPINAYNTRWHDYHWLGQLLLYKAYSLFGYSSLRVAFGLLMSVLSLTLFLIAYRERESLTPSIVSSLLSLTLLHQIASIRPQMLGLLALAGALYILKRERRIRFEIFVLFLFTVVLTNIHVYWCFVPLFWLLLRFPSSDSVQSISVREYVYGLLLLSVSGFFTPYTFMVSAQPWGLFSSYSVIVDYLNLQPVVSSSVGEFRSSLSIGGIGLIAYLASLIVIARYYAFNRKEFGYNALLIVSLLLSVMGVKYLGLFAIVAIPALSNSCRMFLFQAFEREFITSEASFEKAAGVLLVLCGLFSCVTLSPWLYPNMERLSLLYPTEVCRYLATIDLHENSTRETPHILTHFDHGGWCKWELEVASPGNSYRVTTDNRTQGVSDTALQSSFDLFSLRGDWMETLKASSPEAVVVSKFHPLSQVLALSKDQWELRFQDSNFALFLPIRVQLAKASP